MTPAQTPVPRETSDAEELRRRAETLLHSSLPGDSPANAAADPQRLLHELQVHEIELELQNEQLRQAQAETEAALERFADFHDFSPAGFFTLGQDGTVMQVNLSGARLLGLERSRLIGRRFGAFIFAAGRSAFDEFLRGTFAGDTGRSCELELVVHAQPPRIVQVSATLSPDQRERRTVAVDVTAQEQVVQALRLSERRLRDVADVSADWVWEVDLTGRYTYASANVRGLLGYAPDEIIGRTAFDLMPDNEAVRVQAEFAAYFRRGEVFRDLENIVLDSLGGRHDTLTSGTPVRDGAGQIIGYRGVNRDITRRRRAEEALKASEQRLREMADSLESKVAERTAQLRTLSAQLTLTEERERRMLAQDLHDNLGQLLAAIKIKLTSLPGNPLAPSIREVVELVEQADRAARNVGQALSPPILQRLDLASALEWLGEEIERVYGLRVHVDLGECHKHLAEEIQAVLYRSARELLINVARHAAVRDASLICLCDDDRLVIAASDAGCGFEPADHFGAWSGHHSFGLRSIHERIVNLGGEVDIDSSPGNGTTVTLSVPFFVAQREIRDDPHNTGR